MSFEVLADGPLEPRTGIRYVEGYSLERARMDRPQLSDVIGEFVDNPHSEEVAIHRMTPQESVRAIASHLDALVDQVTESHNTLKLALEDKEAYNGDDRQFHADLLRVSELARRHLAVEQANMKDFIHRYRHFIVDGD